MLKNLKQLIDARLGANIALDDMTLGDTYFIKLKMAEIARAASFLKHDPDTSLTLFYQMIFVPQGTLRWTTEDADKKLIGHLLYELKSLKLPYAVTLAIEAQVQDEPIPSLSGIYLGARFFERDISKKTDLQFESSSRNFLGRRGGSLW